MLAEMNQPSKKMGLECFQIPTDCAYVNEHTIPIITLAELINI